MYNDNSEYENKSIISYPEAQRSQISQEVLRFEMQDMRVQVVTLNHWRIITYNLKVNLKSHIYQRSDLKSLKKY